jgi:hypothetical protein
MIQRHEDHHGSAQKINGFNSRFGRNLHHFECSLPTFSMNVLFVWLAAAP